MPIDRWMNKEDVLYTHTQIYVCVCVCLYIYTMVPSRSTVLLWLRDLHNSMKLWAMPCWATQDGQVIVKSSDKMWSSGGGNGEPLQYSCHENPMNSMKRQKDMTLKDEESPGRKMCNMPLGKSRGQLLIASERTKWFGQSRNDAQLWVCLVVKVDRKSVV